MLAYNQPTIGQVEFNEDNISEIEKLFVSGANDIRQGSENWFAGSDKVRRRSPENGSVSTAEQNCRCPDLLVTKLQKLSSAMLPSDLIAGIMIKGYSEIINSSHQEIFNQFSRIAADYHEPSRVQ